MKIRLIVVGKTAFEDLKVGESRYEQRLIHYCNYERITLPDIKTPKTYSPTQLKEKEGELILSKLKPTDYVVLLDENGSEFSSVQFSQWLSQKQMQQSPNMVFIIGGAFGFSPNIYNRAQFKIALSKMTFSHQMVRVIFLEQLYRAFSIIKGEPYHHV